MNEDSGNGQAIVSVGKDDAEAGNEAMSSAQTKDEKLVVARDASSEDKDVLRQISNRMTGILKESMLIKRWTHSSIQKKTRLP